VLRIKAYAKINLSLKILGRRADGFHELDSIMQSVSLADIVHLELIPSGIELATNNLKLPIDRKNIAYQAAALFFSALNSELRTQYTEPRTQNKGVKIYIEKNIPLAAGLAGGSADGAAVLFGLNKLYGSPFARTRLMDLGAQIGSDVPFCILGGNCTVKGRGELVTRNPLHVSRSYVLVTPEVEVSTKWAYEAFDKISNDKFPMSNEGVRNDLEAVVVNKHPVINKIKKLLIELGCRSAQMSGSGPTVFGEVRDEAIGEKAVAELTRNYSRSYLVKTVDEGVAIV